MARSERSDGRGLLRLPFGLRREQSDFLSETNHEGEVTDFHFLGYYLRRMVSNDVGPPQVYIEIPKPLRVADLGEDVRDDAQDDESTPSRIRTCDLRIRSPLLYPAELWAQNYFYQQFIYYFQVS